MIALVFADSAERALSNQLSPACRGRTAEPTSVPAHASGKELYEFPDIHHLGLDPATDDWVLFLRFDPPPPPPAEQSHQFVIISTRPATTRTGGYSQQTIKHSPWKHQVRDHTEYMTKFEGQGAHEHSNGETGLLTTVACSSCSHAHLAQVRHHASGG